MMAWRRSGSIESCETREKNEQHTHTLILMMPEHVLRIAHRGALNRQRMFIELQKSHEYPHGGCVCVCVCSCS